MASFSFLCLERISVVLGRLAGAFTLLLALVLLPGLALYEFLYIFTGSIPAYIPKSDVILYVPGPGLVLAKIL